LKWGNVAGGWSRVDEKNTWAKPPILSAAGREQIGWDGLLQTLPWERTETRGGRRGNSTAFSGKK